ncbi:hypothetical protein [Pseudomonas sp. UM16]|uniref:hypothetical protein n=1 Tax=Pseudomonas sp. UM16 TaxID=3158962 RepID=UPI00398FB966
MANSRVELKLPSSKETWGGSPFTCLQVPKLLDLRIDLYGLPDMVSNQYYDGLTNNT